MSAGDQMGQYDFMICLRCRHVLTKLQILKGLPTGALCCCGSKQYAPSNPPRFWWLRPDVLWFAWQRYRGHV